MGRHLTAATLTKLLEAGDYRRCNAGYAAAV